MPIKSNLNVEIRDIETEIIEVTLTDSSKERRFGVGNRGKEIIATVWGSDDNQNWEEMESKTVAPDGYVTIFGGLSHHPYVKLMGRTTIPGETSVVDGYLTYSETGVI